MGVSKKEIEKQKTERLGEEKLNNQGCLMKIIEYSSSHNIIVEFQDKYKARVHTTYQAFKNGEVENNLIKMDETKKNNQGCLMKIIEYNDALDIVVEFQDEYGAKVHTQYSNFKRGNVKNPYYPSVYGIGITGNKCPTWKDGKRSKEYNAWQNVLTRCFDEKTKEKYPTYKNVVCCKEWLLYDNFYEWIHKQSNFDKWHINDKWHVDKDILVKGNKIYSPKTCCLVPQSINKLFLKHDLFRGDLPIGVVKCSNRDGFIAKCMNPITGKRDYLGYYDSPKKAFFAYKNYKEDLIKQVAKIEFDKGNITKECYEAMMVYEVEIDD